MMMTLIKHVDRVKIACFAQLVNVIAPIMTEPGTGSIWRQTIFYPLFYMSRYGRGTAIKIDVQSPTYHCARRNSVPFVDAVGVQQQGELSVFLVNRNLEETAELEIEIPGEWEMTEWVELYAQDIKETNSFDKPDNVKPQKRDCEKRVVLKEHSWNMIRYRKKAR